MSSSESEEEDMALPAPITEANLGQQIAKITGPGVGFFGTTRVTALADVGTQRLQKRLKKADAFGDKIGTPDDADRQLDILKDTGLLKQLIDESNSQLAVTNPKAYLNQFNKDKMDVLIRSAKAAMIEREILSRHGASTDLANEAAKGIFAHEKAKQDLIMAFKYPSDVLKDVEKKIRDKSLVTV